METIQELSILIYVYYKNNKKSNIIIDETSRK